MALIVKDRVQETSATTGTGTFTLSGAVSGFQSFSSAIGNGNTTYYTIVNGSEWEIGIGTVGAGTLSRDIVLDSSTGSAISFTAGTKAVFVTYPAGKSVTTDGAQTLTNKTLTSPTLSTPSLGTPASGTLTNCTGLPNAGLVNSAITINGTSVSLGGSVSIFPVGGIIIWSGSAAAIPSGWLLCNGLSGTPDLRDRFVVGAGSTYAVGAIGGSANATLVSHTHTGTSSFTGSALGTHNHSASFSGTSVTPAGSVGSTFTGSALGTHTHTATSSVTDPGHFHNLPGNTSSGSIRQTQIGVNSTAVNATSSSVATGITVGTSIVAASAGTPAGSVSSSFTGTAFTPAGSVTNTAISAGTPAGSVSTSNSTEGSSATNANLPPYYALCYIMKS